MVASPPMYTVGRSEKHFWKLENKKKVFRSGLVYIQYKTFNMVNPVADGL